MNWKTMSPITILLIVIVVLLGTVGAIYAYSTFSKTYQWGITNPDFELFTDNNCDNPLLSTTMNFGSLPVDSVQIITVYAKNTGDTPISLTANTIISGATPAWITSNTVSALPVGNSAMFSLELTITGAGNCILSFNIS